MRSRRLTDPVCRTCGLPLAGTTDPAATCGACIAEPRHFTVARALLPYAGPTVPVIRHFKFRGDFFLGPRVLEAALRAAWLSPDIDAPEMVVPVPLHPRRRRERGYDQALLLARVVARHFGCALERRALVRTRYTSQQSLLPVGRRLQNVRGAFTVRFPDRVAGRRVLLVDDVLTTGVTAGECARTLRDAGAVETQVFTLARALP
jgi:ComF family protein